MTVDAAPAAKKAKKAKDKDKAVADMQPVEVSADEGKSKKRRAEEGDDSERKKKKKRKDKEEKEEQADVPMEVDGTNDAESEAEWKRRKKEKKERKRKEKEEKEANKEETLEPALPTVKLDADSGKKEKKKKDKKHKTVANQPEKAQASSSTSAAPPPTSEAAAAFLKKHSITITTPPVHTALPPVTAFPQLAIPDALRTSFEGFKEPTPIQACAWPHALLGRDVVGIAETGSGKTLAFGIPALARLLSSPPPPKTGGTSTVSVLVVAPTRELALQTQETLAALGAPLGIGSVAVFGGVPKEGQIKQLRNLHKAATTTRVIVGTPGRILDLVQEGVCDLSGVNYLVLDEADRMLDKGFENDIRNIIERTRQGSERQTMMFSATWPDAVRRLAASFQRDPVRVTVGSDDLTANSRVAQSVEVFDDARSKDSRLLNHLRQLGHKKGAGRTDARVLVFALYKKEASRVENRLRQEGYSVGALHGDMSQTARLDALEKFKTGTTGLLVATDVAARGLDIPDVAAVINYTFPLTIEDYIHRIGRTGRGGKTGKSITFFTGENHERALAGELARVLRESGFECEGLKKFPMTIKKKEHSAYGAFFRDDIPMPAAPTKIVFD
ncbi:hypothetical protein MIND_00428100 [Mycena indigotica]|uniref:RNA helicase n=1 Tax=Mycena indigotica TaxID=2126181 RepID=A0A8H6WBH3_9AGAR|nr:uncharacterized protein MIND_00428100 [Mycena indigotica]KAF7306369.1 hypothetical protein MIND_00428100 [Mycena indigotica]